MSLRMPRWRGLLLLPPGGVCRLLLLQPRRWLSPQQTSIALRPLYFVVHPDLFGKHPRERSTNEQSLKKLSEYLSSLETAGRASPTQLTFFLRDPSLLHQDTFPQVRVALDSGSVRAAVRQVLAGCRLPLDYLETLPAAQSAPPFPRQVRWHPSFYAATGRPDPEAPPPSPPRVELTLQSWLRRHRQEAEVAEEEARATMAGIQQMREELVRSLGLREVRWDCVWSIDYFRSALLRFQRLFLEHPAQFRQVLEGRTLVFGNNTGVSTQGQIVLSSDDVPTTWLRLLAAVPAFDSVLARLPLMEAEVSGLLNSVQICQHQRHQLAVMARDYELLLNKLLNALRRCQGEARHLLGQQDLSHLQLVVEDESGPLMLTPTGQILIPASLPGPLVLDFLARHQDQAASLLLENTRWDGPQQEELLARCREELGLAELGRERGVSGREMAACCLRLLDCSSSLAPLLHSRRLLVSSVFSVSFDGQLVVPWNWRSEEEQP